MKRMLKLFLIGPLAVAALSACTPREAALWRQWHSQDPEAAMEFANNLPAPSRSSGWSSAHDGRTCSGLVSLLQQYNPGWDVNRMAGIAYRESRCQSDASNSCCSGVLQLHRMHVPVPECNVWSRSDLYDPAKNICAAADLWRAAGYGAWSTS